MHALLVGELVVEPGEYVEPYEGVEKAIECSCDQTHWADGIAGVDGAHKFEKGCRVACIDCKKCAEKHHSAPENASGKSKFSCM